MQIALPTKGLERYKSNSQRARIATEEGPDRCRAYQVPPGDGHPTGLDPFHFNDSIRLNQPYYSACAQADM